MSWLHGATASSESNDAVLELLPEPVGRLEELVDVAWTVAGPSLLTPAAAAVAAVVGAPVEPAPATSNVELAAVAYAEQFTLDPSAVRGRLDEALRDHLGGTALADFVASLNVVDGYLRTCSLLELEPRLPDVAAPSASGRAPDRAVGEPPRGDGTALREYRNRLIDPRLIEARGAYARAVLGLAGVDEVTTEVVRLRNAQFQQCEY